MTLLLALQKVIIFLLGEPFLLISCAIYHSSEISSMGRMMSKSYCSSEMTTPGTVCVSLYKAQTDFA